MIKSHNLTLLFGKYISKDFINNLVGQLCEMELHWTFRSSYVSFVQVLSQPLAWTLCCNFLTYLLAWTLTVSELVSLLSWNLGKHSVVLLFDLSHCMFVSRIEWCVIGIKWNSSKIDVCENFMVVPDNDLVVTLYQCYGIILALLTFCVNSYW